MSADDGQNKLLSAVLDQVIDTLERQLSEMSFFNFNRRLVLAPSINPNWNLLL